MEQLSTQGERDFCFFVSLPALLWQVLFLVVPLAMTVYFGFVSEQTGVLSFENYRAVLDGAHLRIIARSVISALLTGLVSLVVAYPVAYFLALRAGRWKAPLLFLAMVPFWTNFLVQIYAWFFMLERNGVINTLLGAFGLSPVVSTNSIGAVFLVMVYCYLPFMLMSLYIALERFDERLLESSSDLGAAPWQTFMRVTLPLSMPGIRTGLLLVLIPAFGEYAIPALLGGSHYMFVGSLISYYALVARDVGMGAAFTGVSGLVLLGVALAIYSFLRLVFGKTRAEGEE